MKLLQPRWLWYRNISNLKIEEMILLKTLLVWNVTKMRFLTVSSIGGNLYIW